MGVAGEGLRIEDAAVVSWPSDRERPLAWQASDVAGVRPFAGAFWGMLIGLLFLLPISDQREASQPDQTLGGAGWDDGLVRLGLDAAFAASVRAHVGPGSSGLFVFDVSQDRRLLSNAMPPYAREVTRLIMTADQMAGLHAGFDG